LKVFLAAHVLVAAFAARGLWPMGSAWPPPITNCCSAWPAKPPLFGRPRKNTALTQRGLSVALEITSPAGAGVASGENRNWLNGVGRPIGGQRAQKVAANVGNE
jgi:hypothetical protein